LRGCVGTALRALPKAATQRPGFENSFMELDRLFRKLMLEAQE
jgi:hypothetical protein